jgi:hypothetical protein
VAEQDTLNGGPIALSFEERLAGQRLPEHDRGRIKVGLPTDLLAAQLLRRHVGELPFNLTLTGRLYLTYRFGDPEVDHPRHAVHTDQDVLWGDVPVNDAERFAILTLRLMRRLQTVKQVTDDRGYDRKGYGLGIVMPSAEEMLE